MADLREVHGKHSVYGVKKMHHTMERRGWHLGREQTRRLIRRTGLRVATCAPRRPPDRQEAKPEEHNFHAYMRISLFFVSLSGRWYSSREVTSGLLVLIGWA